MSHRFCNCIIISLFNVGFIFLSGLSVTCLTSCISGLLCALFMFLYAFWLYVSHIGFFLRIDILAVVGTHESGLLYVDQGR